MLIDKSTIINPADIVAMRLTNGEEVLGKVVTKTDTTVTIAKPIIITLNMVNNNQAQIGFHPFMAAVGDDQSVILPFSGMSVLPVKASKDMTDNYLRATTSLDIPAKPSLIKP